jgi:pimeloyl-ACP methyl ester carboxylesterase
MERLEEAKEWEPLVELETQVWTDGPGQAPDRVDPALRRQMVEWNLENYRADQNPNQPIQPEVLAAERLGDISVPVLAIWGLLDEAPVLQSGEKLVAEVKGARSHVFDDVAHMVNLEKPEEFNRMVRAFLDEAEATG